MIKIHKLFKYLLTLIVLIPVLFLSRDAFGVGTVTIKKDQITLVKEFKNVNKGHSHAQGGIITDKYYVFASFNPNKSANSIYVVDRKSSKSREIGVKGLGHMNTFLYDWGKDEAIIMDSNSKVAGCLVGLNGKLKNIDVKKGSGYDCASKRPFYPNTNNEKAKENWRPQGRGKWGKYVMQLWWRDSTPNRHDTKIYVYKDKKLVKIFYIPVSVIKKISKTPGEIEDVSFDENGDVYLSYGGYQNGTVWGGTTRFYKIKRSVFEKHGIDLKDLTGGNKQNNDVKKDNGDKKKKNNDTDKNDSNNDDKDDGTKKNNEENNNSDDDNSSSNGKDDCAIILTDLCDDGEKGVENVLNLILDILTYGVGIAAAIGITISGITYLTAKGNEQQTIKAKRRIYEIVIGLVAYAALYALLKFLNVV